MYLVLTIFAIQARRKVRIPIGSGGDENLLRATRAHGSFIEHTIFFLISIFLLENNGVNQIYLYTVGFIFVIARTSHAVSFYLKKGILRQVGVVITLICYISNLVYLIKSLL
jgi:uncharacterized membrane protein YecN with MAPEG domain